MIDDLIIEREKLQKILKITEEKNIDKISFEFLVGSCFPNALNNIKEEMRHQYTLGYIEGQKEGKND